MWFKAGSQVTQAISNTHMAKDDPELLILLPPPPKSGDGRFELCYAPFYVALGTEL